MKKILNNIYVKVIKPTIIITIIALIIKENSIQTSPDYTQDKITPTTEESTIDKVILTLNEQGYILSDEALKTIEDNFKISSENSYTEYQKLDDNFVIDAYENIYELQPTNNHKYKYYNSETDEFDIVGLTAQILANSQVIEKSGLYDAFLEDEIYYVLNQLITEYIPKYEKEYNIDKAEIACNLANLSICYDPDEESSYAYIYEIAYATEKNFSKAIILNYCDAHENIYEFNINEGTSLHEFFHLICKSCSCNYKCENETYYYPQGVGIDYKSLDLNDFNEDLIYRFINEALAEKNIENFSLEPQTYQVEDYILNNIIFAISLNPNFEYDSVFKDSIEKNPIDFIRNFMVNPENDLKSFVNNVELLSIYDYLLLDAQYQGLAELPEEVTYNINDYYESLINFSQTELSKQFFNNLILYNEVNNFDAKLNAYYISLFYQRLMMAQLMLEVKNIGQEMNNHQIISNFLKLYNNYLNYLKSQNLNLDDFDVLSLVNDITINFNDFDVLSLVNNITINFDDYNFSSEQINFYQDIESKKLKLYLKFIN